MRKIKKLAALMLMIVLLAGAVPCARAAAYPAKVFTAAMQVYNAPSTSAQYLGALGQGTAFNVRAISGSWAMVEYRGRIGFAQMSDIIFGNRIPGVVTATTSFNYVTRASFAARQYYTASIQAGTGVYVVGIHGAYLLVANADNSILGYIRNGLVRRV